MAHHQTQRRCRRARADRRRGAPTSSAGQAEPRHAAVDLQRRRQRSRRAAARQRRPGRDLARGCSAPGRCRRRRSRASAPAGRPFSTWISGRGRQQRRERHRLVECATKNCRRRPPPAPGRPAGAEAVGVGLDHRRRRPRRRAARAARASWRRSRRGRSRAARPHGLVRSAPSAVFPVLVPSPDIKQDACHPLVRAQGIVFVGQSPTAARMTSVNERVHFRGAGAENPLAQALPQGVNESLRL